MSGYANPRTDPVPEGIKRCSRCEIDYEPTTDNFPRGSGADGLDAWCKTCVGLRGKRLRQIKAAETRASDMLALEVGRASWDETGWRLDRLGIDWTDELAATVTPLAAAYTTTQSDDDLRAIGRALIDAGATLSGSGAQSPVAAEKPQQEKPKATPTRKVPPSLSPEDRLARDVGAFYVTGCLGVEVPFHVRERVASLVARSAAASAASRAGYSNGPDWAGITSAIKQADAFDIEIGREIVAAVGVEAATAARERVQAEARAVGGAVADEPDEEAP